MPFASLFHSEVKKDKMEGQMIHYSSGNYLNYISNHDNIVIENDKRLTAILEDVLSKQQDILFMVINIKEFTKFINGKVPYILCLYGLLINSQKAVVSIMRIWVFFDILIPNEESIDIFEIKIRGILSNIMWGMKLIVFS